MNFTKEEIQGDSLVHHFNKIIDLYPNSYLVESAYFYKGFYYLQKYGITGDVADIKSARLLFIEFLGKYSNTVFKGLVKEYLKTCNATLTI
ncbi:hypothetical protein [Williamwhitmania taraxaci]|uniref:Uncharacterized protein n=1 Tax=Williamwhitmania taraxaci TaxID=1640674 RepID=A0A1G6RVX2_9BACT|nr:hypothetical protein [Williamwhitmania taraxaci]SDD08792.1 hypothetical protein SAMN05216323_10828 [Williamwhitmania taraxaci]